MLNVEVSDYFISRVSHISAFHHGTTAVLMHESGAIVYASRADLAPILFPVEYGFIAEYQTHALDCDGCDDCISADEYEAKHGAFSWEAYETVCTCPRLDCERHCKATEI